MIEATRAMESERPSDMAAPRKPQPARRPAPRISRGKIVGSLAVLPLVLLLLCRPPGQTEANDDAGPLWLVLGGKQAPSVSPRLGELLHRVGPNMRASADYRDFRDIQVPDSLEGWQILHRQVDEYANKLALEQKPKLDKLLKEAKVSDACVKSTADVLDAMSRLESWAIQMWSYSGNFPPVGAFAGHFHDVGSYEGCVDLTRPTGNATGAGEKFAASYCTVGFRPIVPVRPRFHLIWKLPPRELVQLFNASNIMARVANQAQYFHYIYWKMGICVPGECSPEDVQQVSKVVGRKLALMSAPVKCFTRAGGNTNAAGANNLDDLENSKPVLVDLERPLAQVQWISLAVIGAFFSVVLVASLWHAAELTWRELTTRRKSISLEDLDNLEEEPALPKCQPECDSSKINGADNSQGLVTIDLSTARVHGDNSQATKHHAKQQVGGAERSLKSALFYYFSVITNSREFCDTRMGRNEIKCLHGFRVGTMLWIICVHVMQYNDWSGFTRVYENVPSLQNPFLHPIINANYVVDNFFLMSGLLVAYTTWNRQKGAPTNFSMLQSLLGRYLRLTPQVLLISLMYIVLPSIGDGPFWYDMTHYAGKYCEKNWWVNLLHLQAFYHEDEICNLVGWWISVDMCYYLVGIVLLWLILNKRTQLAFTCTSLFVGFCTLMTIWRHYTWGLSPNNLGLVPQVNEVWTEFVVKFFWSPYPHAYVFFLGLWLGYLLANNVGFAQVQRWSKLGWFLSLASLVAINLSSRLWLIGALELTTEQQLLSTTYNVVCVIVWASSFGWMIVACHYGCAPLLNKLLYTKAAIMLSKASFIIYLSHMLILRLFYGSQYNLFEVSLSILTFLISGMTFLSVVFGVFLHIAFEAPCLKLQRLILNKITSKQKLAPAGLAFALNNTNGDIYISNKVNQGATAPDEKMLPSTNATGVALFKGAQLPPLMD